jgi:sugar lactone lactonase YvrE
LFPEDRPLDYWEASLRTRERFTALRTSVLALATFSDIACTAETPQLTGSAEQAIVNPPLPSNLNLILNAKTTVTIGAFTQVFGDVGSAGLNGSVLFDVSSSQSFGGNALANTVNVRVGASVGHIFGNDITVDGFAAQQTLGFDPTSLPSVPAGTVATPGTANVSVAASQAKQLCPGQFGAISLGTNATLNLNGGVYQVTRLTLADGAKLEPSEPVVILVSGGVTTGIGASIRPSAQSINPMTAADIRIEAGGAITLGDSTQVRAHLLVPTGKLTTGKNTGLTGAAWAKAIVIGSQSFVSGEGVFSAQAPSVPPPCNDNNTCTTDTCVGSGTAAFCRNTPVPTGTSCGDGNACNGDELCDAAAQCQPGTVAAAGTSCSDSNACNGDETCNGSGTCVPGAAPVVSDGNTCTADACDPAAGVSHVSLPDGTTCARVGVCEAGTCSVPDQDWSPALFPIAVPGSGFGLGDLALDNNEDLLAVSNPARAIVRVNHITGEQTTVATGIGTSSFLLGVAYRAASDTIYANTDDGQIFSVTPTGTVTPFATVSGELNAITIAPPSFGSFGGFVIGVTQTGSVVAVNPASGAVTTITTAAGPSSDLTFAPNGILYIVGDNTVRTVTATGVVTLFASGFSAADGITVAPDGTRMFVTDWGTDSVRQVTIPGAEVTAFGAADIDDGFFVGGILAAPGNTLIVMTGEGSLTLIAFPY